MFNKKLLLLVLIVMFVIFAKVITNTFNLSDSDVKNIIYTNDKFGFTLKLPSDWKNYKYRENDNFITFQLPTKDLRYDKKGEYSTDPKDNIQDGYADVFYLYIYKDNDWKKLVENCQKEWGIGCVKDNGYLTTNKIYYLSQQYPSGGPNDFISGKGSSQTKITPEYLKNNLLFNK